MNYLQKLIGKTIILLTISVLNLAAIYAVPANPHPVTTQQPDGTTITYLIRGDERVHWMQSPDGYTLLRNDQQFVTYAELDADGNLTPSKHIYGQRGLRSDELHQFLLRTPKNLRYSAGQVQKMQQINQVISETVASPVTGSKKALCVLINFKDKQMTHTKDAYYNLLNQIGYSSNNIHGSVKDYYLENSYGQLELSIDLAGPYTLADSASHYGNENTWSSFARASIQAVAADPNINLSEYATNGKLETFHILFAGYGDENIDNGKQIWSHQGTISTLTLNGVKVSRYSCSPQLRGASGNNITTIGVICHELCHVFGAPDYYDTDYESNGGNYPGTDEWDLMANGSWNGSPSGSCPAHINMFQKILYGWVTPTELVETQSVTDIPNAAENPVAYIMKPYTNNEQYVLENRQKVGFDASLPGNGLIIYHIHNSAAGGSVNNTKHPQQAYIVYAASTTAIPTSNQATYGKEYTYNGEKYVWLDEGTPFAGTAERNKFTGYSTPRLFRWSSLAGTAVTEKALTNITQANGLVSFDYQYAHVENLQAEVLNDVIRLSWEQPQNTPIGSLTYEISVGNTVVGETIEPTYYYQPEGADTYNFSVQAYNEDCKSKKVSTAVVYTALPTIDADETPYPNPVRDILHLPLKAPAAVSITDMQGRTLYSDPHCNQTEISAKHWQSGIYFVKIRTEQQSKIYKIVK